MNSSPWKNFKGKYRLNRNRINKNRKKIIIRTLLVSAILVITVLGYRKHEINVTGLKEVLAPVTRPFLTVATYAETETKKEVEKEVKTEENKEVKIEEDTEPEMAVEVMGQSIIEEPELIQQSEPIQQTTALITEVATFIMPTRGTITSPFGHRWGKKHGGIDIGARIGEPINVADSGTVVRSEFNKGGYGYMIDVDHGNGYVTRYAHCSKLFANIGDKVNRGDVIAAVGNTGRSTGPHLHFEVRKDGVPQDPQGYLN